MVLRLAREEGVFAGTSTDANVVCALRSAEQLGLDTIVVTIMVDTGMKYLRIVWQGGRATLNQSRSHGFPHRRAIVAPLAGW